MEKALNIQTREPAAGRGKRRMLLCAAALLVLALACAAALRPGAAAAYAYSRTVSTENYDVTVSYNDDAAIPGEAELRAAEYAPDSENFLARCAEAGTDFDGVMDIGFYLDGEKTEPAAAVSVTVTGKTGAAMSRSVTHFTAGGGMETLTADGSGGSLRFTTDSFSDFGVKKTAATSSFFGGTYGNGVATVAEEDTSSTESLIVIQADSLTSGQYIIFAKDAVDDKYYALVPSNDLHTVEVKYEDGVLSYSGNENLFWDVAVESDGFILSFTSNGKTYYLNHGNYGDEVTLKNVKSQATVWDEWYGYVFSKTDYFLQSNNGKFRVRRVYDGEAWEKDSLVYFARKKAAPTGQLIKVYVYVAGIVGYDENKQRIILSDSCLKLLGIDKSTLDQTGYFPVGQIYLDSSFFDGKTNVNTEGAPLITLPSDWDDLLTALSDLDKSTLENQLNVDPDSGNYSGLQKEFLANFSLNQNNKIDKYLAYAEKDTNCWWGTQKSALFLWHSDPYYDGYGHYGFADQNVKYHLDLRFEQRKVDFNYGNNEVDDTNYINKYIMTDYYIKGMPIAAPDIKLPEGYEIGGYYKDVDFTDPWDGIGQPILDDQTVYIKLAEKQSNLIISKTVENKENDNTAYSFTVKLTKNDGNFSELGYIVYKDENNVPVLQRQKDNITLDNSNSFTLELKDGEYVNINGIPDGTSYTVTETSSVGFTTTVNGDTGKQANGTTTNQEDIEVKFVNTYPNAIDLAVHKTTEENGDSLSGAKFALYYIDKNDTNQTKYYWTQSKDGTVSWTTVENDKTELETIENGVCQFSGLESGKTYYLEETKAPDGYIMLTAPIAITVTADGNIVAGSYTVTGPTNGVCTITVPNSSGYELPSTGGGGVARFMALGLALMGLAAGGMAVSARRKYRREDN